MQIPNGLKPGLWGVVIGAVGMAIVGFWQLGWTTAGSADRLAQERVNAAVVATLVPFCVLKAQQDPDEAMLTKFQAEESTYSRNEMVEKAGWATFGSNKSADSALARACSDKLYGLKAR